MSVLSNIIGKIMGQSVTKQFVNIILSAVKLFLGKLWKDVYQIVREEVLNAEAIGGDGWTKWRTAYEAISKRIEVGVPEMITSILIETAVMELKGR